MEEINNVIIGFTSCVSTYEQIEFMDKYKTIWQGKDGRYILL